MLRRLRKISRKQSGFTMIEMMVVMIIIAVLIAGGFRFYTGYIENAKVTKAKGQIGIMQGAMDSWFSEKGAYPASNGDIQKAGIDITARDPWGETYSFDGDGAQYTISTGYGSVQGTSKHVVGSGENGKSNPPDIET